MKRDGLNAGYIVAALAFVGVMIPVVLGVIALFTGWGALGGPQNTFNPVGEVAGLQRDLFLIAMWPALVIFIGVFAALLYIVVRFQRRDDDPMPKQVHGNTRLEVGWTVAPTLLLAAVAVPTIIGIIDLGQAPGDDAFPVTVTAEQWLWRYEYPSFRDAEGNPLEASVCIEEVTERYPQIDCVYVPVGRTIDLSITAPDGDVNHSFWIPKMGGKQDAIPGHTNKLWLKADEPGIFHGQCAEFCGIGHPVMRTAMIALEETQLESCLQALSEGQEDVSVCSPNQGASAAGNQ